VIVIRSIGSIGIAALLLMGCAGDEQGFAASGNTGAASPTARQASPGGIETPAMDATGAPAPLPASTAAAASTAAGVADGSTVRVESSYLESGWLMGKIGPSPSGCRMVFLDKATEGGYTSVALMTLQRMERKEGDEWRDVAIKPLLAAEPPDCLEAAAD